MIPSINPQYRWALARPHKPYSRVEVWRGALKVDELSPAKIGTAFTTFTRPVFFDGQVRATYNSRVTRTLTLSVPQTLYPWAGTELLNPYGTELRVFRGIEYGSGARDEFPIFVGPITKPSPGTRGSLTINASDRAIRVVKAGFSAPATSSVGTNIVDEARRLILAAVPDAVFGPCDTFTETTPQLAYDNDRGSALDNLLKTANAVWYCLADGRFVVRRTPWSSSVVQAPVMLKDGPGGTLANAIPDRDTDMIFNRVTVTSERPDGGAAMYATASDDDPASLTYVGGPFGVRSTQVRVTGAVSQSQLLSLAKALVRRAKSQTSAWSYTMTPDPSLELGDLLASTFRDQRARQYLFSFTMPLGADALMNADGRDTLDTEVGEL